MLHVGVAVGNSRKAGANPPPLEHWCDIAGHHLDSKQHPQEKGTCRDVLPCPMPPEPPAQHLRSTESWSQLKVAQGTIVTCGHARAGDQLAPRRGCRRLAPSLPPPAGLRSSTAHLNQHVSAREVA